MLEDENIICFSSADWDNPLWTNKQHIMSRLSKSNKVLYIESIGVRNPSLRQRDIRRIVSRVRKFFRGLRRVNENLYVYSPVLIPFHGVGFFKRLNEGILMLAIKHYARKLHFDRPIIWTYLPNTNDLVKGFEAKMVVYHCVDEISQFPGVPHSFVEREKDLLRKSDLVFVTSEALYENKKKENPNTFYLPNVADVGHFSRALSDKISVPEDLKSVRHPILGFVGAIDDYKIDCELLEQLAGPDWSIVLIGPVGLTDRGSRVSRIIDRPGIYLLGPKQYKVLPDYLRFFDVCLIPYNINEYTTSVFPMKSFEYLAAGKRVVSTDLPSLRVHGKFVSLAKDRADFRKRVEEALATPISKEEIEARVVLARENSWEKRIESMSDLINKSVDSGPGVAVQK